MIKIFKENLENCCMILHLQDPKKANSKTIKEKIDILDYIKIKCLSVNKFHKQSLKITKD